MIFADQEKKNIAWMLGMVGPGRVDRVRGGFPVNFKRIDKKRRFTLDGECTMARRSAGGVRWSDLA